MPQLSIKTYPKPIKPSACVILMAQCESLIIPEPEHQTRRWKIKCPKCIKLREVKELDGGEEKNMRAEKAEDGMLYVCVYVFFSNSNECSLRNEKRGKACSERDEPLAGFTYSKWLIGFRVGGGRAHRRRRREIKLRPAAALSHTVIGNH